MSPAWSAARDRRRARRTATRSRTPSPSRDRDDELARLRPIAELMRRGWVRPLEEPPSLHQMAKRRLADDTTTKENE